MMTPQPLKTPQMQSKSQISVITISIVTQPKVWLLSVTTGNHYFHLCTRMHFFQTKFSLSPLKF